MPRSQGYVETRDVRHVRGELQEQFHKTNRYRLPLKRAAYECALQVVMCECDFNLTIALLATGHRIFCGLIFLFPELARSHISEAISKALRVERGIRRTKAKEAI